MNFGRRIILLSACVAMSGFAGIAFAGEKDMIVMENDCISAVFNPENGALVRLTDKHSGWDIVKREFLGQSFELLLPMDGPEFTDEDCGYNVVKGTEQEAPEVEYLGNGVAFTWKGLRSSTMKDAADVQFRGVVMLTEYGLEYSGTVVNNSGHIVEYVSWPCLGEVSIPDRKQFLMQNTRNDSKELFPHFNNQHGYWGVEWPTSTVVLNDKSYLQVNDDERGFMVFHRETPEHLSITSFELIPGLEQRFTNPWQDEIDGVPVRMQLKVNNCVYALPGESVSLDPVSFVTYKGDMSDGVRLFRSLGKPQRQPFLKDGDTDWVNEPLTWRKANASDGNALMRIARESVDAGVDVLLLGGWYSRSSGIPVEGRGISEAVAECRRMGLKVVLETDFTRVDRHADVYMTDYRGYIMSDPYGVPYTFGWLCPGAREVRKIVSGMYDCLPALDLADGYQNRENNHNDRTFACFAPNHAHRYGEPAANGIMKLNMEMSSELSVNGGKTAFGNGFLLEQNDIFDGYVLNVPENMYSRHRLLAPYEPIVVKVGIRDARTGMNKAVLYRLNVAYDLNFYNDRLSDYVHVTEYGRQIEDMRNKFADIIWNAEFCGHKGADVIGSEIEWSVFERPDGKCAVVLSNNGVEKVSKALVSMGGNKELFYISPEDTAPKVFNGSVDVNPLSVVVVFER